MEQSYAGSLAGVICRQHPGLTEPVLYIISSYFGGSQSVRISTNLQKPGEETKAWEG